VADEVGRFTYYCNVWCDPYHYRMRGTLEVVDPAAPEDLIVAEEEPSFAGLDIDSRHEAEFYPATRPSAVRGQALAAQIELPALGDGSTELAEVLRSQSPSAVFKAIRQGDSAASLSDEEVWDLVAYLWSTATTPERVATGEALYAKNCAACHGETGGGDGPGGRYMEERPTDFTNAMTMAGGSSEIYYAKTQRGGMGTGMPYWGTIFSEEETWGVVDYLWTFLFDDVKTEEQ
ncbi:MAG: c-type cytochrome, partial [Anaerolineae bacterium]